MKYSPLYDRVIIKPILQEEKTRGGIYLPDSAKEKPQTGQVMSVGHGTQVNGTVVPLNVAVDDIVLFGKYSGTEIKIDEEDCLIMRESEIFAIVS